MADDTNATDITRTAVPMGSIVAYWHDGVAPDGWLMCDGKAIPRKAIYKPLGALIGPRTPDLRGMFLRGAGQNKKKELKYTHPGERQVGSPQSHTTALPSETPLEIAKDGRHSHGSTAKSKKPVVIFQAHSDAQDRSVPHAAKRAFYCKEIEIDVTIAKDKGHSHPVTGGDEETRPNNYAVNFIIKAF